MSQTICTGASSLSSRHKCYTSNGFYNPHQHQVTFWWPPWKTAGHAFCCFILYTAETTLAVLVSFHYLYDRDLLFAHVQTSAGLLLCFMTISVELPCHQGLWPRSLILSCVSKFQTLAESFQFHRRTPKCCHSPFPDHLALWVQDTSGDLWERGRWF